MGSSIRCEIDADRIITVWFNQPGKSVNTLPREVVDELSGVIAAIEADTSLRGVVFASEKATSFLVGADLQKLRVMDRPTLEAYIADGQHLYNRIERLAIPTVAAINGHCLGGGLELALGCRIRLAADNVAALIGLPETAIGLIPAWGGTVRLSQLIGCEAAIPLLIESRKVSPSEALRLGIVDEVVPPDQLLERARNRARLSSGADQRENRPTAKVSRQDSLDSCESIIQEVLQRVRQQVCPHDVSLPAAERLVRVLDVICREGVEAGLKAEREAAVDLHETPECRERLERFFNRK